MLSKLTPSLGVSDLPRSLGFYHDALGFEVLEHYGEGDRRVWCHLGSGKAELMLQQLEESQLDRLPRAEPCWVMVVRPEDAGEILKRLRSMEWPVEGPSTTTYGTEECFCRDPDGYELWISWPASVAG